MDFKQPIVLILLQLSFWMVSADVNAQRKVSPSRIALELERIAAIADSVPLQALGRLDKLVRANSRGLDDQSQQKIYLLAGRINYNLEQFGLAASNFQKAIASQASGTSSSKSKLAPSVPVETWYLLARAQYALDNPAEAMKTVDEFLDRIPNSDDRNRILGLVLKGQVLIVQGLTEAAIRALEEANDLSANLGHLELRLETEFTLAAAYQESANLDQSLTNYQEAITISDSLGMDIRSTEITQSIGNVYQTQNDVQGELSFKQSRRAISIERDNKIEQSSLGLDIADIYIELDQPEEAIPYLQESVELSEEQGNLQQSIQGRKSLSNVYASSGDYVNALENYRSYVALVDQLYENKEREIALSSKVQEDLFTRQQTINSLEQDRLLYQSEIALLEKERALQAESLTIQRLSIYGLSALILVVFGAMGLLYRSNRQKKVANQLLALKSLRSQLNPHFIFNALNSVNNFISVNDTREANKYLVEFSRLMRIVMENSQKEFIPLAEEIEVLSLYLKLEHFRFRDKFDYQLEVDEELTAEDFYLPPMIAQPYIENAVWHGLRYKETKGKLYVGLSLEDDHLIIQVTDDGIGRRRSREIKTANQKKTESTGMKNTQGRVDLLNQTYRTQIRVAIADGEPGTNVQIIVPRKFIEHER